MVDETRRPVQNEPRRLPGAAMFSYSVPAEAWYGDALRTGPEIMVSATSADQGCHWEFGVRWITFGQSGDGAVRVEIFSDAYAAFTEIPDFFAALAERNPRDLDAVRAILEELGAVDRTPRTGPNNRDTGAFTAEAQAALRTRVRAAIDAFPYHREAAARVLRDIAEDVR